MTQEGAYLSLADSSLLIEPKSVGCSAETLDLIFLFEKCLPVTRRPFQIVSAFEINWDVCYLLGQVDP